MNLENLFQSWEKQLSILGGNDLLRRLPEIESVATGKIKMNGREIIQLASNNYLGLNIETTVIAAGQKPQRQVSLYQAQCTMQPSIAIRS